MKAARPLGCTAKVCLWPYADLACRIKSWLPHIRTAAHGRLRGQIPDTSPGPVFRSPAVLLSPSTRHSSLGLIQSEKTYSE